MFDLRPEFKVNVEFLKQDIRNSAPAGVFHLVLCRNLAFIYFDVGLQVEVVKRLWENLSKVGYLVIGGRDNLPQALTGFKPCCRRLGIYQKADL